MLQVGNNIIINIDDENDIMSAENTDLIVLTCGLKLNSTITASSIADDGFTYCLQRSIFTLSHKRIAPQEFNVKWTKKPDDIFASLAIVTAFILCDVDLNIFKHIRF